MPDPLPDDAEVTRILSSAHCFDLLQLPLAEKDASTVKAAYKRLSLVVHPDKCSDSRAKEAFQAVLGAKEVLLCEEKRLKHLKDIAEKAAASAATPSASADTAAPKDAKGSDGGSRKGGGMAWMHDAFEFLREAQLREQEEQKQRKWREIHEERRKEEAERQRLHAVFERKEKQHHDPLFSVERTLAEKRDAGKGAAHSAPTLAFLPSAAEGMLLRTKVQRLADEVARAERQRDDLKEKKKKKKRRKRDDSDSLSSSSVSSLSGLSEEVSKRRKKKRKKDKKDKKDKKSKKSKSSRWDSLRQERLMREAGECVRQAKILK